MFDPKKNLTTRLTDAVDLMIDFATLGEYGLEPVGRTRQGCPKSTVTSPARSAKQLRPTSTSRIATRTSQCNLLEASGLCKPPSARVTQLRDLRGPRLEQARMRGARGASDPRSARGAA
jgi:hypothetical protein